MMGEFGEPWEVKETVEGTGVVSHGSDDHIMGPLYSGELSPSYDEMIRICACVNFLSGVPTEDLEVLMKHPQRSHVHAIMEVAKRMREGHSGD